ncbi:MAG TPA: carboxypeptidase-like regulatory domain-containing protein, partial [Mucilaginibacter sp.]
MKEKITITTQLFKSILWISFTLILTANYAAAQSHSGIKGRITNDKGNPLPGAIIILKNPFQSVITDTSGRYAIETKPGHLIISVSAEGYTNSQKYVTVKQGETATANFTLPGATNELNEVVIKGYKAIKGMGYLNDVHDGVIYSGKKTEVIVLDSLNGNTAQNNPRQ